AVVRVAGGQWPELRQIAVRVADLRMLDVHDLGAEVREHRSRRGSEDEGRELDDAKPIEQIPFAHRRSSFLVRWLPPVTTPVQASLTFAYARGPWNQLPHGEHIRGRLRLRRGAARDHWRPDGTGVLPLQLLPWLARRADPCGELVANAQRQGDERRGQARPLQENGEQPPSVLHGMRGAGA